MKRYKKQLICVTKASLRHSLWSQCIASVAVAEKLIPMRCHFLDPSQIAALFPSDSKVIIETKENTAWIITEKEL
jgi:hypothetical protein